MTESMLLATDAHGVATLTMNRPDKLNAFDLPMIDLWHRLLTEACEDPAVKVIVLTGAGRAFCAGGDVGSFLDFRRWDSLERKDYLWKHVHRIVFALERAEKPVIAAINGLARGAGLDMALMCDLRIMAKTATLAESYINMGLVAGDAGTYFLPRIVGTARALELFWTGRSVGAEEAERIGLVNRVVADDGLQEAVTETARAIAAQPQSAIRMFKRAVYQSMWMPLAAHLDMVSSHMSVIIDTPEHKAKVDEFLNRGKGERGKGKGEAS
jgi:enoyl-CoA hydratase/carnithine racemase